MNIKLEKLVNIRKIEKGVRSMNTITVIMSCYNCESSIDRSIQSILDQTYDKWMLYMCDDGSSDGTKDKLYEYANVYSNKIKVFINEQNQGLTYSLNKMLEAVETDYIIRMDADDIAMKTRFHKQFEFLEQHEEFSFCGSWVDKFDEDGVYGSVKYAEFPTKKDFYWNSPFAHPTIMIRSSVLKGMGGYRDIPKTVRCEDYDLWFRLYENNYIGYNIQEPLLEYYEGRESFVKRKFKYRINESKVRFEGYHRLHLYPKGYLYVMKPLILGLLPAKFISKVKRNLKNG